MDELTDEDIKAMETSFISREQQNPDCPPAHNRCSCMCHSAPGVKHCVPCCFPEVTRAGKWRLFFDA